MLKGRRTALQSRRACTGGYAPHTGAKTEPFHSGGSQQGARFNGHHFRTLRGPQLQGSGYPAPALEFSRFLGRLQRSHNRGFEQGTQPHALWPPTKFRGHFSCPISRYGAFKFQCCTCHVWDIPEAASFSKGKGASSTTDSSKKQKKCD